MIRLDRAAEAAAFHADPDAALRYNDRMAALRARVKSGRLVLNEPTTLPEGMVVDLVADDEGDDFTADERVVLHEALSASWKSVAAGRLRPASAVLDELRDRR